MTRLDAFVVFPPRYARTAEGLHAAEQKLARLTDTHAAYANQPDTSTIWQGYIDKQADAVDAQRPIVQALRDAIALPTTSAAVSDALGGNPAAVQV